jgi:hypothetical protein
MCPKCREAIDDQFNACWKCAGESQEAATPPERKRPLQQFEFVCVMLIVLPGFIAVMNRNSGGGRLRAVIFDLSVMALGAIALVAIKIYQHRKMRSEK